MKQHTEYKPQSNFISTISIKQKYQDAYKEMRSKCHKYKISQGDVLMYGYSELLVNQSPLAWKQLRAMTRGRK